MENIPTPGASSPALTACPDRQGERVPAGKLDVRATIARMRAARREHLIHYAGAAHRDSVAWHFCIAYSIDPTASEAVLKSRALKAAWGVDVDPAQIVTGEAA